MGVSSNWYKESPENKIWWKDTPDRIGEWVFSFNKKEEFNMFSDYPYKLTEEQIKTFNEENPYWASFFSDRTKKTI